MTSKITIEACVDTGRPYIRVIEDMSSDDLRDKTITAFRRRLKHESSWAKIIFGPGSVAPDNRLQYEIHPIPPDELCNEAKLILSSFTVASSEEDDDIKKYSKNDRDEWFSTAILDFIQERVDDGTISKAIGKKIEDRYANL